MRTMASRTYEPVALPCTTPVVASERKKKKCTYPKLFNQTVLMGRGDGLGVVKQQERTVQKLIMAAGRVIEQTSLPLSSFPIRAPHHLLFRLLLGRILINPPLRFGIFVVRIVSSEVLGHLLLEFSFVGVRGIRS